MEKINIDLTPEEYSVEKLLKEAKARKMGIGVGEIGHIEVVRRSLDSRRGIRYHAELEVYRCEEIYKQPDYSSNYQNCEHGRRMIIVGAGPAGLFAALKGLELGLKPIVVERGRDVKRRKLDIGLMARSGEVNGESNWCFGEGGAGTFSDGKLYTRSTKRGDVGVTMMPSVPSR